MPKKSKKTELEKKWASKPDAPMVFADASHLGDRKLDAEGVMERELENTRNMNQKYRHPDQDNLEKQERSAGPRMEPSELIRRVKQENSELIVRDGGLPNTVALYVYVKPHLRTEGSEDEPFAYVAGFVREPLPEFSHLVLDDRGLPKREYRGWRSVVIALIKSKALTYEQAVRQFGEPTGQRAYRWFEELKGHRR